jgi:hypothetical protein
MNSPFRALSTAALASAMVSSAFAQGISVVVNGETIQFRNVGPIQREGRVLVPLRGVMEKLGAYVSYDAATKRVTANRGDVDIELRIGERMATVNGSLVSLDAPAIEYRGSTMVPLRFMGEALGAEVLWNANAYAVVINTAGNIGGNTGSNTGSGGVSNSAPPVSNPSLRVSSFEVSANGVMRAGSVVTLRLTGTAGGQATFEIPGVVPESAMRETEPGVYTATYTIPTGTSALTISKAAPIARLRIGNREQLIQGNSFAIDAQPPEIRALMPLDQARVNQNTPTISAVFDEGSGSGIDANSVIITVDGRNVMDQATVTSNFFTYRPAQPLSPGTHTIRVQVTDRAGNTADKSWTFNVVADSTVISSFTHNAGLDPTPGTEIEFRLTGEPGSRVTFSIGDMVVNRAMTETNPGVFVGRYTVRTGDSFAGVPVTARLITPRGETFTREIERALSNRVATGAMAMPAITSHKNNETVGKNITLTGTAAPNARVLIRVDYSRRVGGLINLNGTLHEFEVQADANGRWSTESLSLDTGLVSGRGTTYTVVATASLNGRTSEETTLTLKR